MLPAAQQGHALPGRVNLSLEQLAKEQWLLPGAQTFRRAEFDARFQRAGVAAPEPAVASRSSHRDLELAEGLGLMLTLSRSLLASGVLGKRFVAMARVQGWRSNRVLGLAWRSGNYLNPLVKRCVSWRRLIR
jgi:DNA-binding transcriptional LysR family regulator